MARPSTGAWTVYESSRIELPYLLKHGYIQKGFGKLFTLSWKNQWGDDAGSISCLSSYFPGKEEDCYLELIYSIRDRKTNDKNHYRYKVMLTEVPSNLGQGTVLYFICPQSGKRCRILYRAYGSEQFKSRDAYRHRLYYDYQQASKLSKYNDTYWRIDKHLEKIRKECDAGRRTYNGIITKKAQRYNYLHNKKNIMDELRWTLGVPKSLQHISWEEGFFW